MESKAKASRHSMQRMPLPFGVPLAATVIFVIVCLVPCSPATAAVA